jgi:hypothetical protein
VWRQYSLFPYLVCSNDRLSKHQSSVVNSRKQWLGFELY